jgi:hypothetical protein
MDTCYYSQMRKFLDARVQKWTYVKPQFAFFYSTTENQTMDGWEQAKGRKARKNKRQQQPSPTPKIVSATKNDVQPTSVSAPAPVNAVEQPQLSAMNSRGESVVVTEKTYEESMVQDLPQLPVQEIRTLLRKLWAPLVVRRVSKVITQEPTGTKLVRFIDLKTGCGGRTYEYPGLVDIVNECAVVKWDCFKHYYGFTYNSNLFQMVYQTPRPELYGQSIYFGSESMSRLDLWDSRTAWLTDNFVPNEIPPDQGSCIMGLVNKNERGFYFSKWFVPSPQFVCLFYNVMGDDKRMALPFAPSTKQSLNGDHVYAWSMMYTCDYYKGQMMEPVNKRIIPIEQRIEMMKIKSFIYDTFAKYNGLDLYYLYQMFATGDVIDYKDDPDEKSSFVLKLKVLFYNIKYRSLSEQKFQLELLSATKEERKLLRIKRREALMDDQDSCDDFPELWW